MLGRRQGKLADIAYIYPYSRLMCSDPGACKFGGDYWYRWRLPLFGEKDVNAILREAAECHKSNPDNRVPLIGYDSLKQTQGAAMAVCRGKGY